jgi:hypothetical protein
MHPHLALSLCLLLFFAVPSLAQTRIDWTWNVSDVNTLGYPGTWEHEIQADYGTWIPFTGVTCGPPVGETGLSLSCSWQADVALESLLTKPGSHYLRVRARPVEAEDPADQTWAEWVVVAPSRVGLPLQPCPYTNFYDGIPSSRPVGYVLEGVISFDRLPTRLPELQRDGWVIFPKPRTATALPIRAVCRVEQ